MEQDALLSDPCYLLNLHKRVTNCLLYGPKPHGAAAGSPPALRLSSSFLVVDQQCCDLSATLSPDEAMELIRPIFSNGPFSGSGGPVSTARLAPSARKAAMMGSAVTARDLQLLRELLPMEELSADGGGAPVSPGEVLFSLLQLLPQRTWLVDEVVRRVRASVKALPHRPHLEEVLYARLQGDGPDAVVSGHELVSFLLASCGLSVSQALLLADYCAVPSSHHGQEQRQRGTGEEAPAIALLDAKLDADLVYRLCLEDGQLDAAVAYPLLAAQFAEAAAAPYASADFGNTAGTLFILAVVERLTATEADGAGAGAVPAEQRWLSERAFRQLCRQLGVPGHVPLPLFDCLCDPGGRGVAVHRVLATLSQFFPAMGRSLVELRRAALLQSLRERGDALVFVELFLRLRQWGTGPVPLRAYMQALRQSGGGGLSDLDLEALRCLGHDRVSFLRALTTPVPPGRDAVIDKVVAHLVATASGAGERGSGADADAGLSAGWLLQHFVPDKMGGAGPQREGRRWWNALAQYLEELVGEEGEEDRISAAALAFFLSLLSAGVDDDPSFTMMLWQGFGMADAKPQSRHRKD